MSETEEEPSDDDLAAAWGASVDSGQLDAARTLNQAEIDNLLGF